MLPEPAFEFEPPPSLLFWDGDGVVVVFLFNQLNKKAFTHWITLNKIFSLQFSPNLHFLLTCSGVSVAWGFCGRLPPPTGDHSEGLVELLVVLSELDWAIVVDEVVEVVVVVDAVDVVDVVVSGFSASSSGWTSSSAEASWPDASSPEPDPVFRVGDGFWNVLE